MLSLCMHVVPTTTQTHTTEESYLHDQNYNNIKCHIYYCVPRSVDKTNSVPILTPHFFYLSSYYPLIHTPKSSESSSIQVFWGIYVYFLFELCKQYMSNTCREHHTEMHGSSAVTTLTVQCLTHSTHNVLRIMDKCCHHTYRAMSNTFHAHCTENHGQVLSPHLLCHV